jgi:serine/threonine-protein kinase mTOR
MHAQQVLHDLPPDDTARGALFAHAFGRDLTEADEWLQRYRATRAELDLHQAWDLYYHVFRRMTRQLQHLRQLDLGHVAPALLRRGRDLQLAVPGTYKAHAEVTRIARLVLSIHLYR